jgi:tetratricopeptide (TPR) repeat protein
MRLCTRLLAIVTSLGACQGQTPATPSASRARAPRAPAVSANVVAVSNLFAATTAPPVTTPMPAPFTLTASDGSGLELARVDATAVVEGPLALTELHLYFHNPEARRREGTFAIALPAGAAVSRFAMEIDGQFMEAAVVEKQRARRVYEDFLHQRQDPALLEKGAGNAFSARVFPIAANADKHLVVSYSQDVTPGTYTLPLRGLAKIASLDVRVRVRGTDGTLREQAMSQKDWKPDRDVVVASAGAPSAITAGELAATRVNISIPDASQPPAAITLLVDTSASRALGFAAEAHRLQELVGELARAYGGALPIQVVAFDQASAVLYEGRADAAGDLERALVQRGALGASDLGQALAWAGAYASGSRVVLVTDGVITAGADVAALRAVTSTLAARGVERVDVVLSGGIRDADAAAVIARAGLAHAGAVLDLDRGAREVARRIGLAVGTDLPVTAEGARWISPRTVAAAQSGDEVTIFLRRDPQASALAVAIAGTRVPLAPVAVPATLLMRAVETAEIAELDAKLASATGAAADTLRAEVVARSVASRVVSSQTSMLVLESDADYERYGIDPTMLAEILTVGPRGVELTRPTMIAKRPTAPQDRAPEVAVAENRPDDGAEESGGSRTAMALEEGRMGKRDDYPPAALVDAIVTAQNDADRTAAIARLAELRSQQAELNARIRSARATAERAERRRPIDVGDCVATALGCLDSGLRRRSSTAEEQLEANRKKSALQGRLAEIETRLRKRELDAALRDATAWRLEEPGNVLALVALGDALEAKKDLATAARVYGSIIDLYPARADFRRFAGERLERLGNARALIIDTYRRAVAERPDHLTGHRLLAYALVRDGQLAAAFDAILAGLDQRYPGDRFVGGQRVLVEDAGMIGAAYVASAPGKRGEIVDALRARKAQLATEPSTRFILYWETDANDVDFHIEDARGGHAWYESKHLASGGQLYADITTGYGPECFTIRGAPTAAPYKLSINYFSQGPMGYGMGLLQVQRFDGKGRFVFDDRPYVIMTDGAFVDLGTYR